MKKPQRHFIVERKLSRKTQRPISKTIWGDVDLRSITRAVQDDATLFSKFVRKQNMLADVTSAELTDQAPSTLSLEPWKEKRLLEPVTSVVNPVDPTLNTDTEGSQAVPDSVSKKQRKPRIKKAVSETASIVNAETSTFSGAAGVDRGRQTRARKKELSFSAGASVRKNTGEPAIKPDEMVAVSVNFATDELVDLLQLEQENQHLRKLLAEKLRVENADLRKRLGLG
ncbi:transcriptional regulator [Neorhizobium galegae]|uniref:hypothetical protein n=1 Tax=Neorhizobium galegae TaxID=399 RepID=UPI000620FB2B|nr:hypothetical protein [Neorhizobium galegae]MCQ1769574.1 transcriptional regulator [Neorhizobium galegae]MCQ1849239.1 transcriptional regulator [Neorhizobium galegae]CDZ30239.1 Hypothetical protein NGAL_HAMBI490_51070 [Neorhizobium galegae bv. officinalis]CDZ42664.1 Hypothetical protein NGAL_HAMBI1146_54310 [Neorhizobium galegae bv. officinalis]